MTSDEVRALVRAQMEGKWDEPTSHHMDLRKSLVEPRLIEVTWRVKVDDGWQWVVGEKWLVCEERPEDESGYKIVYDENVDMFGLATPGKKTPTRRRYFVGFYGDLWNTLKGM